MPPLTLVFVVDGLRPDAIGPDDTPTLDRLRAEGVAFADAHAAFPTVTRVNAATIATGAHPRAHGILGNAMYVPAVEPRRAFSNDDWRNLVAVERALGRVVGVTTLAERVAARGGRLAAVSSGSTGSGFLLNPRAPAGVGVLVNGYMDPGTRVAFPDDVNATILARFGAAPKKGGSAEPFDAAVDWTQTVLHEYVLPELRPDVVLNWITEPDHTQHTLGAGSPEARASIRNADRHIARILERVDTAATSVIVASDHGFGVNTGKVAVARELLDAGLKAAADSEDVVLASSGQAMGLHVRDAAAVPKIVAFLQSREWIGVVFTKRGAVEGTFPLDLINADHPDAPDVLFTFTWTSARNAFGVPGTDVGDAGSRVTSDHGSLSPWTIRSTLLAWGPAFKRGVVVRVSAGNVDVTPTILALHGIDGAGVDGRVLREALVDGPDEEQVVVQTRAHRAEAGAYRAVLQISEVDGRRYVDKGWRVV